METIRNIKQGTFFKLNNSETSPVWVRGEYDKSTKTFSCYKFDDVCHERFFKGSKLVNIDFEF